MRLTQYISTVAAAVVYFTIAGTAGPGLAETKPLHGQEISVAQAAPAAQPSTAPNAPRRENGDMVMGAPDAPVTVIEYASLTCPHCAKFHTETLPKLKSDYIDTGRVKYVFRDFPLDRLALSAAMIAQCAGPERYFTFLDVFFRQQPNWTRGSDQEAMLTSLKRLARVGGMSDAQIDECLKNKQVQDAILASSVAGQNQFQVRSTPTLIINGERHAGALSFEELDKILKPLVQS
jgi:protein-disulfide isomerase